MSTASQPFDRAAHLRKDLDFLERSLASDTTRIVPMWREQHIVAAGRLVLPTLREAADWLDSGGELVWLGLRGQDAYFALDISSLAAPLSHPALRSDSAEITDLRMALMRLPAADAELAFHARALLLWHARHRFCGVCGYDTRPRDGGHVRVCARPDCGVEHFPRTDPCVLVLVNDGERCLLGRQHSWPKGMYSALAGFVEPAETLEAAAARETQEEAGIAIDQVRYHGSQAWPFPASLMIGFSARATTREIRLGDAELEDARWFSPAEITASKDPDFFVPPLQTLAGQMIAAFLRGASRDAS